MGNQENIPGECVSGFIPATHTHTHVRQHDCKAQKHITLKTGPRQEVTY